MTYLHMSDIVKHREILTALNEVNRELVVYDKNEWIKRYVDPSVVSDLHIYSGHKKAD